MFNGETLMMSKRKLLLLTIGAVAVFVGMMIAFQASGSTAPGLLAENTTTVAADNNEGYKGIGAGLAVGLAGLGSSIGMGLAAASAIGAISEKPELFGKTLIYVVLIEAVAIYGLLVSFILTG